MQVILDLGDCSISSIRVYRSFAKHIQYSSSFCHTDHLIRALNHCYQVGQYLKHHAQKRPNILKLCLRVSYYSGIILSKMFTYYSQNYAGIIGAGLKELLMHVCRWPNNFLNGQILVEVFGHCPSTYFFLF